MLKFILTLGALARGVVNPFFHEWNQILSVNIFLSGIRKHNGPIWCFSFCSVFLKIFMAIIAGVMQMAGTGEQMEDIGDARSALSSLMGVTGSV